MYFFPATRGPFLGNGSLLFGAAGFHMRRYDQSRTRDNATGEQLHRRITRGDLNWVLVTRARCDWQFSRKSRALPVTKTICAFVIGIDEREFRC